MHNCDRAWRPTQQSSGGEKVEGFDLFLAFERLNFSDIRHINWSIIGVGYRKIHPGPGLDHNIYIRLVMPDPVPSRCAHRKCCELNQR